MECSGAPALELVLSVFICLWLQDHVYSANPNWGQVAREEYMTPSKWEAWLKFLKYFDLWGWENDRILESVRPVVVRVVGTAACCVPGPGRNSCVWTSQHPGPTGKLLEMRRAGSDARAGGGSLKQGSFGMDPSHPFGFLSVGCGFGSGKTES